MSELMQYEKSSRFSEREKVALRYADAIMYDPVLSKDSDDECDRLPAWVPCRHCWHFC